MKKKEIKEYAKRLAELEIKRASAQDEDKRAQYEKEIMAISMRISQDTTEDEYLDIIAEIDDLVQEILEKILKKN